ncbi:hypothetical protein DXW21_06780 [Salmonella enterica]|uniref:Uncharacterized protein n=3 Tax=Salmonella enterica TaxID=28901 RepID=A0A5Y0WWI5_SALET|nr:hypothetical protein LFZ19_07915 [Salmonella enterica subsp. enterica serovar Johannesburg str. ST203]EAA6859325.1 hypothetical protein [Salmonella enterica subsp. enterica serovar Johannesburg]EAA7331394.1 hypothetical protein [Salmonella enterica subsp. enterica]EAA7943258.1 hypothetical protein [Salmonella enterica]EAB9844835.1 hypothetical protein [Salmonella enterica subsp. enterica serovar Carmel]EBH8536964.1 hypothetical protein [Salmonella enterica subsp. enterica serovar Urbana]EC
MTEWHKFNNKFHKITNYFNLCDRDLLNTFESINLNRDCLIRYIFVGDYWAVYGFIFGSTG